MRSASAIRDPGSQEILVKIEKHQGQSLEYWLIENGDRRELSLNQQAKGVAAIYKMGLLITIT
jgi:hypothetical protein